MDVKTAPGPPLFIWGDKPDHFDGDMHGYATVADIHVYDDKVAAYVAESAAERFPAADTGIDREEHFVAQQAKDAVFEAFAMEIVHLVRHGLVTADVFHHVIVAVGLHVVIALIPVRIFAVHRP
jgi:hypothetical protein